MKDNKLTFRMAARCEAAGRPNNEDNFLIDDNLADSQWGFTADSAITLGNKGALLVVCDGMGGMNAGEVASAIAVATIKEWFAADRLTDRILESSSSIQRYIVDAIQAADAAIKQDSASNPEHEGMGSTIVLAWLLGQKVYVGWCGDSRAYRYNTSAGLVRLSHDHSYVQELVDAGKLTEELAFDHPNNNIITRSLGDPRGKAQPDTKEYDLANEDVILLCSDGLCGCLRDNEIEEVIRNNRTSMQALRDALWQADEAAGWHDNVTIALAQVLSGGMTISTDRAAANALTDSKIKLLQEKRKWMIIAACLFALVLIGLGLMFYPKITNKEEAPAATENAEGTQDDVTANNETADADTTKTATPAPKTQAPKTQTPKNAAPPRKPTQDKQPAQQIEVQTVERNEHNHKDGKVEGVVTAPQAQEQPNVKQDTLPTLPKDTATHKPMPQVIQQTDTSVTIQKP